MTLYLFNTTIITGLPGGEHTMPQYRIFAVSAARAAAIVNEAYAAGEKVISAVGHDATAEAFSTILGRPVAVNRIEACQEPGDRALCLKLRGRLPEGAILDAAQLEAVGYDLYVMARIE